MAKRSKTLPYSVRSEIAKEVSRGERIKSTPELYSQISNKSRFLERIELGKKQLEAATPKDIEDPRERDQLMARTKQIEEVIVNGYGDFPGMPSYEDDWKVPAGYVGHRRAHEYFIKNFNLTPDGKIRRVNKKAGEWALVDEWKENRRRLYKEAEEFSPDIARLSTIQPENTRGGSKFINYTRRTFAPGFYMDYDEWNEATGHEMTEQEKALAEVEPTYRDDLYALGQAGQCTAKTQAGQRCKREALKGRTVCGLHKNEESDNASFE